jgi:hypothetical protein
LNGFHLKEEKKTLSVGWYWRGLGEKGLKTIRTRESGTGGVLLEPGVSMEVLSVPTWAKTGGPGLIH